MKLILKETTRREIRKAGLMKKQTWMFPLSGDVSLLPDMKMLCLESLNRLKSNNLRRSITVG